ncbi:hypothetical protein [Thiorhodovibrio frisius]|uniref:Uncharacterized protein n=1 Tax=Thiorhodovibrio frisius TaxID=631362 RepID=H8Z3U2_9GAMM|nr:hypothetical protein [Thiorhodovibrio frisius]EIC21094.1 hypothetical protein Thi970DRAFT_04781 [Thiorhodovibrio frisius]WPL22155.1 hypothetical protein Thiofri_02311 [Thiorhodovibrio frisius]
MQTLAFSQPGLRVAIGSAMRQALLGLGLIGVSPRSMAGESAAMGARVAAIDGVWLLVMLVCAAALAVALMLDERSGVTQQASAPSRDSNRLGHRLLVAVLALSGLGLFALAGRFIVAALAGGALLALAWGLHASARPAGRLSATPALWMASLVVLIAVVAAGAWAFLLGGHAWDAQTDQGTLITAVRWMLSLPVATWLAGLLFGTMLIEIAGMLLGLLLLMRPARLFAGMVLLHAGLVFFLAGLAARYGGDSEVSAAGLAVRLHGLGVAVIVMGLLFASMLAAVRIALERRAGALQPQVLDDLASREWLVALGEDVSGEDVLALSERASAAEKRS